MKVLSDGVPFTDSVEFLESNRYAYEYTLRNDSDIRIDLHFLSFTSSVTVQVMVNDNDIFYSVVSSDRTIDISHTDIAFTPCLALAGCMIHITLFGSGATTDYELTLSTSHSVTLLRWGRTVKGIVQPGKYIGYRILITEPETSVSAAAAAPARSDIKTPLALDVSTTVLSDVFRLTMIQFTGQVTASVSCSKGPSSGMPNITNHLWILRPSYSTFLDIPILFAAAAGCFKASPSSGTAGSGQLLITVHGDTASSFSVAMSLLSNSSSLSSATLLTPGLPSVDSVADKEFRYYTVRPGIASEDIRSGPLFLASFPPLFH